MQGSAGRREDVEWWTGQSTGGAADRTRNQPTQRQVPDRDVLRRIQTQATGWSTAADSRQNTTNSAPVAEKSTATTADIVSR